MSGHTATSTLQGFMHNCVVRLTAQPAAVENANNAPAWRWVVYRLDRIKTAVLPRYHLRLRLQVFTVQSKNWRTASLVWHTGKIVKLASPCILNSYIMFRSISIITSLHTLCLRRRRLCFHYGPLYLCSGQHRHFFGFARVWLNVFRRNLGEVIYYHQQMNWLQFGRILYQGEGNKYVRKFESTSSRCCHVANVARDFITVHTAFCDCNAVKSVTHK